MLDLNGESGDDSFTVRSFLLAYDADKDEWKNDQGNETLNGGFQGLFNNTNGTSEGNDSFTIEVPEELPDYIVNSLVDIDGGTGSNRLTIVGTEAGDRYVIQDGKIFGGGLTIKFTNIAFLDAAVSLTCSHSSSDSCLGSVNLSFLFFRCFAGTRGQ